MHIIYTHNTLEYGTRWKENLRMCERCLLGLSQFNTHHLTCPTCFRRNVAAPS